MIKAIQTRYKGFHFRSRLEARWAVFFDTLGIEWAYEEEGFEKDINEGFFNAVTNQFEAVNHEPYRYLPDFRIGRKGSGLFVEVKGDNSQLISRSSELNEIHDYDGILPRFNGSLGSDRGLILLGDIPQPEKKLILHPIMQHRKGVWKSYAAFTGNGYQVIDVLAEGVISTLLGCDPESEPTWDNTCKAVSFERYFKDVDNAYRCARSARFEHGESGAT